MSAAANARWIALTQVVKIASQLVNMFVLTRLIAPSEYGLMAMAGVATNLAFVLRDMGTAAAIIQKAEVSDADTSSVFWLNVAGGTLLMVLLFATAPLLADTFHETRLTEILWVLAFSFPIAASSTVHQALLERVSRFRLVAAIESVSSLLALVVALVLAYRGLGVWSLVAQALLTAACTTILMWWSSPFRPKAVIDREALRGVFKFSGSMAGHQLASYLFRNSDSFIVGKMLGSTVLGNYSLAYKLMLFPVQNISWVAVRSLFPVMSRRQDDIPYMAGLTLRSLKLVSFISAPIMFGVAGVSDLFVEAFLGPKWSLVGGILTFLAMVGYVQVISSIASPVLMAMGKSDWLFRMSMVGTPLHIAAYIIGAMADGARGLSIAYLVAAIMMAAPGFYLSGKLLSIKLRAFVISLLPSVLSGLAMALGLQLARQHLPQYSGHLLFVLLVGAGILFWAVTVVLFQRREAGEFIQLAFRRIKK